MERIVIFPPISVERIIVSAERKIEAKEKIDSYYVNL
tara:strand:+ start:449 stop:559 length:111 start_codon:yes stop_codon:yes gene_type:complete